MGRTTELTRLLRRLAYIFLVLFAFCAMAGTENVYLTYHWHLHQPIYWPEKHAGLNRYQYAKDSIDLKLSNSGNFYAGSTDKHPRNNLVQGDGGEYDSVFDKSDRVIAYQWGGKNSIGHLSAHPNAGASVSYSGSLQENVGSLGQASSFGYGPTWNSGYTEARGWTTGGGHPKADMLGMTYHHSFSPLLPKSVLRKEIDIFKEIWWKSWGGNADKSDHSKGFWPIECAFSEAMIPILAENGYDWVIVANSHLARTCANYMDVAQRGNSGWNIDPPNRADQTGPSVPANQWFSGTRDGRGGTFPVPFAYQAHKAKYVDPATGNESYIVVVPMCDYLSYENGYASMGTGVMDAEIAPFANDSSRPAIVLMAHDGDNAWGGGSSYYDESVPNLMNEGSGKGYKPSTIQQFLSEQDWNDMDLVHVEDGAWVNAANDWGHPQFINWLWPPARDPADPEYDYNDSRTWMDIENGFAEDWRNWSIIIAAANFCETAEQIATANGRSVQAWRIQEPHQPDGTYNFPNYTEQAWHFLLGSLDSGFMYYGISLDDEVKQALGCNRAVDLALQGIGDNPGGVGDQTPPTVFKPQRYPWNPGGMAWGPLTGYRPIGFDGADPHYSDFHVWTLVHDYSGVTSVVLRVRHDLDGINPLGSNLNELYADAPAEVSGWSSISMTKRVIGPLEGHNGDTVNFFITPNHMADHYWAKVSGYTDKLLDYYVEAYDSQGNLHRSDIQHVYVGDGGFSGPEVGFSVDPRDCAPLRVDYNAAGGPLGGVFPVYMEISYDGGTIWTNIPMNGAEEDEWYTTNPVPDDAPSATVRFHNGSGTVDDNGGSYWSTAIRDCEDPTGPGEAAFDPATPSGCDGVTVTYYPNDGVLRYAAQVYIHIGRNDWQDVIDPAPAMTAGPSNTWTYTYVPPIGTETIHCVFHDGGATWDNHGGSDWGVSVTGCDAIPIILAPGTPDISLDPVEQNNATDAFDLARSGGSARAVNQGGFGDFGQVYMNYDANNLYIGGIGCDLSGDNNAMVLFLNLNTLGDDQPDLTGLSGPPRGLDHLHNLTLTPPMDIAIVLGDEWGDGTITNFYLGDNSDFGQGIYYLSGVSSQFDPVAGARLSQFDGLGTNATGATDYDGDRLMNRWEACIPWTSLSASDISSVTTCQVAGVIASSSVQGDTRYLSGNYLGMGAGGTLQGNNYGYNTMALTGQNVQLPGYDSDADDLADEWELRYFVNLGFLYGIGDWDNDGASDEHELLAGTDPTDFYSLLKILSVTESTNGPVVRWHSVMGKWYTLMTSSNLLAGFDVLESNIAAMPSENIHTDSTATVDGQFYRIDLE